MSVSWDIYSCASKKLIKKHTTTSINTKDARGQLLRLLSVFPRNVMNYDDNWQLSCKQMASNRCRWHLNF